MRTSTYSLYFPKVLLALHKLGHPLPKAEISVTTRHDFCHFEQPVGQPRGARNSSLFRVEAESPKWTLLDLRKFMNTLTRVDQPASSEETYGWSHLARNKGPCPEEDTIHKTQSNPTETGQAIHMNAMISLVLQVLGQLKRGLNSVRRREARAVGYAVGCGGERQDLLLGWLRGMTRIGLAKIE
ncbi:hypothetical protein GX48_04791 [Paracoccidioides brasiliensis]|nr:hypothetical protein GX48_04791 [Paracoccidioides brasiliensis]